MDFFSLTPPVPVDFSFFVEAFVAVAVESGKLISELEATEAVHSHPRWQVSP